MINDFGKSGSCRVDQKTWTECFLDFARVKPGMDCSDLQSTTCKKPTMNVEPNPYYGAFNIWSTWSYISSWANGIEVIIAKGPEIIKETARPNQFLTQDPIQNIDFALTNMIGVTDDYDEAANEAFLTFMKANPSVHIYDANRSTGIDIGNQLQQRLGELLKILSTDLPSFIKLVKGGDFSRELLYNEQTIENRFMPQFASQAHIDPVEQNGSVVAGNSSTTSSVPSATSIAASTTTTASWHITIDDGICTPGLRSCELDP